ncbi:short-chain dehydrogenase reductase 3b [Elaeis guineensis]|uniref:Short-chain dehydrogenase reductase 3b n=1 Tax=Elaeis guineensis var. tenera TaxID=51953 RepID=A0A6I9QVA3_ELAGV|nr:short-chain dehydrogenase reductase 3b [Elaeis guineensis]
MSRPRLEGKVTIITGGASGIGEATARLFASQGALVIIADIQDELGRAVAASIGLDRCAYRHCDVRDEKQVEATVDFAVQTHGRLDVLFSNAGKMGPAGAFLEASLEEWDDIMAINARGVAATVKHAARAMVARKTRGSIVCTGSVVASRGGTRAAAYVASKHAVLGLVRAAAAELGEHGIRVNCVSPSAVATPLACALHGWSPSEVEEYGEALSRLKGVVLKASHIAEAVLFLASDESEYITGLDLVVDGGRTVVGQNAPIHININK